MKINDSDLFFSSLAGLLSYNSHHSIILAGFHFLLGGVYVAYRFIHSFGVFFR